MWQLPPSHSRLLSRDYSLPKSWGSLRVTALTSAATEPLGKIKMLRFHRFSLQGISIPSGLSQCLGMPGKSAARVSPSPAMRPQRKAESDGFCSKRFANLQLSLITLMAFLASLGSGFMGTRSQPSWASRSSGCKLFWVRIRLLLGLSCALRRSCVWNLSRDGFILCISSICRAHLLLHSQSCV